MAVRIQAHYDGKAFVPDEPVDLQVGEKVQVTSSRRLSSRPLPQSRREGLHSNE